MLQVAHLWWLVGKLSARQTLRFAQKEFHRSGGVPGLIHAGTNAITNPVGTAKATFAWAQVAVNSAVDRVTWLHGMLSQAQAQQ